MKTILTFLLISLTGMLCGAGYGQRSTIYGYVYLVTQRDTIRLGKAHVMMYRMIPGKEDERVADFYANDDGKYMVAEIPYGSYYFKVYYGKEAPMRFFAPGGPTEKGPRFAVDQLLKTVPPMYVRNP